MSLFAFELFARENEDFMSLVREASGEAGTDPMIKCYANMNRIALLIKYFDIEKSSKVQSSARAICSIKAAIEKKYDKLDRKEDYLREVPREKLEEMLKRENEKLIEAQKNLKNTPTETKEALAFVVEGGASLSQPIVCPENGKYSATQIELGNYIIKCSKHGVEREVFSKIYEREMKKIDPAELCHTNVLYLTDAGCLYIMENGYPEQLSMAMLLKTGYLKNKRLCPSGGVYNIIVSPGERNEADCSCSIHSKLKNKGRF